MSGVMSFAMYKAHEGKEQELLALVKKHLPAMREYGLITERDGYIAQSKDGTICEVFEWVSEEAPKTAHHHPGVAALWEAMGQIADFPSMSNLPEASGRFPDFAILEL